MEDSVLQLALPRKISLVMRVAMSVSSQLFPQIKVFPGAFSDFISELCLECQRVNRGRRWKAEIFLHVAIVIQAVFIPHIFMLH